MRITVHNLGVLKEATIDLKPLTIFIGPNNSGKTWLAYALGGVLGILGSREYTQAYIEEQVPNIYKPINQAIQQVITEGNATIDLYKLADDYSEAYFNEVAKYARTWISTCLGTQLANFNNLNVSLTLAETKAQFLHQIMQYSQRHNIGRRGSLLTIRKQTNDNKIFVYTSAEIQDAEKPGEQLEKKIPLQEIKEQLITFVFGALRQSLYLQTIAFPTERSSAVTDRFDVRINRLIQQNILSPLRSNRLPAPVQSFTFMLDNAFEYGTEAKSQRKKDADNNIEIEQYMHFAEVLEKQILAGGVDFSTPEPDPSREILFQPSQEVSLEVSTASSMVKGLSSLVLYLRLLAKPNEMLIIDEPEMNLHPEAQAKMIEFLAMLVNAGLNVLLTTHSPYITDHLTNLIQAYKSEDKETINNNFFLKRTDAFIAREKVAVYGFGDGTAKDVLDEEGFMDLDTFSDVSDRVSNVYFAL